ncbi:thiol reductant ABC exporter subunit CydC [Brachybacterium halotolerans subsp. kimchii]|uniref:thiol reductant ABC exporter subunit CydC n=1 Tax=Brachybacterium halotolerans TaxID=2795215 RepID=UPI001E5607A6|nr:thiol reductant ABC exporter subunit CydC [Brachybacterium halotolerans]UEJ83022.1 thiol reductant ABC exporter subunit CydC [Brachybacterium halotolerans subsp. kimchii]
MSAVLSSNENNSSSGSGSSGSGSSAGASSDAVSRPSALRRMVGLLEIPRSRLLAAVLAAIATLASAFALAALAAWLVTTAWTMPNVLDLTVAVVGVRALGISRGVFRWLDRMLTHDVALRGVVSLRTNLYSALARRRGDALSRVRRGDLLARLGDDAQELGDLVIRAIVPGLVAAVMTVVVVLTIAPLSLPAAACMLLALVLAGVLAPLAAHRAARLTEAAVVETRSELTASGLGVLDDATALRVQGRLDERMEELARAQSDHDAAIDRAALPSALAAASVPTVMILAVLGSVLAAGGAWLHGGAGAGAIGMLVLLPLSSFEAVTALPAAASQLARTRAAAARLEDAVGPDSPTPGTDTTGGTEAADGTAVAAPGGAGSAARPTALRLSAHGLSAGYGRGAVRVHDLDLDLAPGERIAVTGGSGTGKTTLVQTLAGLLEPVAGTVRLGGDDLRDLPEDAVRAQAIALLEDAHVFATTVHENLRVARGDVSAQECADALRAVGLEDWVDSLPRGLDTMLGPDGTTISGGERRRLLLARAVVRAAPITLLDEPTEHLDAARGDDLLRRLLDPADGSLLPVGASALVVTHRVEAIPEGTTVLHILPGGGHELQRAEPRTAEHGSTP